MTSSEGERHDRDPHERLEHLGLRRKRPCRECVELLEQRLAIAIAERDEEGRLMADMSPEELAAARVREAARIRAARCRARKREAKSSRDVFEDFDRAAKVPPGVEKSVSGALDDPRPPICSRPLHFSVAFCRPGDCRRFSPAFAHVC